MKIEIRLFATLAPYARHPSVTPDGYLDMISPATVRNVVEHIALPEEKIKLVFINGVRASLDSPLEDGDRLGLFPPIGGG
jgi:molybdopterin converting factor small subunit